MLNTNNKYFLTTYIKRFASTTNIKLLTFTKNTSFKSKFCRITIYELILYTGIIILKKMNCNICYKLTFLFIKKCLFSIIIITNNYFYFCLRNEIKRIPISIQNYFNSCRCSWYYLNNLINFVWSPICMEITRDVIVILLIL